MNLVTINPYGPTVERRITLGNVWSLAFMNLSSRINFNDIYRFLAIITLTTKTDPLISFNSMLTSSLSETQHDVEKL